MCADCVDVGTEVAGLEGFDVRAETGWEGGEEEDYWWGFWGWSSWFHCGFCFCVLKAGLGGK